MEESDVLMWERRINKYKELKKDYDDCNRAEAALRHNSPSSLSVGIDGYGGLILPDDVKKEIGNYIITLMRHKQVELAAAMRDL